MSVEHTRVSWSSTVGSCSLGDSSDVADSCSETDMTLYVTLSSWFSEQS